MSSSPTTLGKKPKVSGSKKKKKSYREVNDLVAFVKCARKRDGECELIINTLSSGNPESELNPLVSSTRTRKRL